MRECVCKRSPVRRTNYDKECQTIFVVSIWIDFPGNYFFCITRNTPAESVKSEIDIEKFENEIEELTIVKEENNQIDQNTADKSNCVDTDSNDSDQLAETETALCVFRLSITKMIFSLW